MRFKEFYSTKKQGVSEGLARNAKEKKLFELLETWGFFISFKTADLGKTNAVDQNAQQEIMKMRQHYNGPVLNGMMFGEITKGDLWQNPKVIPHLLKYIYQGIPYIEERIKKFVVPNEQQRYLSVIDKIKTLYREVVSQYSGQQGVAEGGIVKSIKRGMQGWGGVQCKPADIKRRAGEWTDDDLKGIAGGYDELRRVRATTPMPTEVPKHSPAGLQKRVVDREMKKRGLGEQGVAEAITGTHYHLYDGKKFIKTFFTVDSAKAARDKLVVKNPDGQYRIEKELLGAGPMPSKRRSEVKEQGVTEDTQHENVDQITRDFVQHYENDPMGVFMHAKSSYLDAVGKAKHFSRKAAALYKSHTNMSKQEFQNTIMKYFGKHLQNNGFPPHASEGWGKAEHELVKELINLDNQGVSEDTLGEVSSNWEERIKAQERIADLVQSRENWQDHPIDDINEMKKLVKIVGRATVIRDSDNYRKLGTAGKLLDLMTHYYNQKQLQSGTLPQFDSAVASSQYFAKQIAMHTNGTYNHRYARVWTTSYGQRYKDPSDYVEYNSKDDLDSAWQWIESKGKKVYYYDHFKHLNEAVKIGKFIVEPASYTMRAFSDSPETVHAVSVRTAAVINKSVRRQVDISDQQANALKDIAATKNKNALEGIKLIMSILQGEQDVKSVIDNSKKLDSNVKAKLDAIIAGAANFKEPDQGVTESNNDKVLSEKAKSKAQQRFFGMAHALQKGKKIPGASTELKQVAKSMGKKDVKDFAKTKHKNLPTHVKKG